MTHFYARHKRTTLAIATAVAAGSLLATGMTTGAAARTAALPAGTPAPLAGSPLQLSASARTALIRQADAATAETAQEIGLGAQEKLLVRDVVKDVDGTVHTRYERTYNGLPVLGGDLVVHETKAGRPRASPRPRRRPSRSPPSSRRSPPRRPRSRRSPPPRPRARRRPRPTRRPARSSGPPPASRPSPTRPSSVVSRTTAPRTSCT